MRTVSKFRSLSKKQAEMLPAQILYLYKTNFTYNSEVFVNKIFLLHNCC